MLQGRRRRCRRRAPLCLSLVAANTASAAATAEARLPPLLLEPAARPATAAGDAADAADISRTAAREPPGSAAAGPGARPPRWCRRRRCPASAAPVRGLALLRESCRI